MGNCPGAPGTAQANAEPISGSFTFQRILQITSWVLFGLSVLLWLGLIIPHLRRYKAPNEQRQIFRIILTPLVFSLASVVSLHTYSAAPYISPIANLYEAFALASLFLLYVQIVAPEIHSREEFFRAVENKRQSGEVIPGGLLRFFIKTWRTVFLYVLIYTILIIIQEITQATGVYCGTSTRPRFAHIWLQVLQLITTVWAIVAVVRFQRQLRDYLAGRKSLMKLISFKLFVVITTLQHFIFSIIGSHVEGTSKITWEDLTIGLPSMLICIYGFFFMIGFYFTFHSGEYQEHKKEEARSAYGTLQAFLHALSPVDLIRGVGYAFRRTPL